ncbi:LacI family DNA-binding transcriptional regulator [Pseudokineococcus sp. 5B2Z-1]|uniref:LacI family DNA-binding transcriptional regulator n=1 Tax=Pseudokineococcus sp. 5B2Z-1 TaxID=3132744 RepID=UPI0030AB60C4
MPRVTLRDVAEHAGVSVMTVSNVVNGHQHVSPAMRQRVRAALAELGYRPDARGRSLATGRSGMVALAFPDLRRPYFAELAHVLARACAGRGLRLLLEETGGTEEGERAVLRDRDAGLVDGALIHPSALTAAELDEVRGGTPVVVLGEDPAPRADQVAVDNVAAARDAVAHLVALGRRRVAFLGVEAGGASPTSRLRLEGYRDGLARAGLAADPALVVARASGDARAAEAALGAALDDGMRLDALLCRDDLAAVGALRALHRRGLDVPGDVAVVGWDAVELGESLVTTLTSVAPDTTALAERALDLLLERVAGLDAPGRHVVVGHRLRVGESAPLPS